MEFFNIYLLLIFIFQFDNYPRQGQKLLSFLVLFKSVKSIIRGEIGFKEDNRSVRKEIKW